MKNSKIVMIDCSTCDKARESNGSFYCSLRMKDGKFSLYSKVTRVAECIFFKIKS